MEIITDHELSVVKVTGRLDANSCTELDRVLTEWSETGRDIILDMQECPYVSSAGIRVLLKSTKKLQLNRNTLFLAGVVREVFHVFEVAGLVQVLRFESGVDRALAIIQSSHAGKKSAGIFQAGDRQWSYHPIKDNPATGFTTTSREILSSRELGFAIGLGSDTTNPVSGAPCNEIFAVVGNCTGFIPLDEPGEADFRITADPARNGMVVCEALSFGNEPAGLLKPAADHSVTMQELSGVVTVAAEVNGFSDAANLLVIVSHDRNTPSLSLLLQQNGQIAEVITETGMTWAQKFACISPSPGFYGITFLLSALKPGSEGDSLNDITGRNLTFENIGGVALPDPDQLLVNPEIWIFQADQFAGSETTRLSIEVKPGSEFEPWKAWLARLLYTDSSKLQINPLHGGYSAQTFQVTSYDAEGRKMRPTVLKVGSRNLVSREAERCRQYALPYIFNNSANVLGSEYLGDMGALRYNFVGIGGESSQLKWLTHYYLESGTDSLEPLFDKIFLRILKPWYGQPVVKTICPFREHDPTFTFFPFIYNTVQELFGVSAEEKYVDFAGIDRKILNPYWFLKYEYERRRDETKEYPTGICHGDLNMQNILLDENMNVYLIDFSETRPRAVISDFARLEAIFMVDNAPLDDADDMRNYLDFIEKFYRYDRLDEIPVNSYRGKHVEKVAKNVALTLKMRRYALESAMGDPGAIPYFIALLEWVLPIVCFYSLNIANRRLSMLLSSILCEKLMAGELRTS